METLGEILGSGETKVASSNVKSMGNNSGSESLTTIIRDIKRDFSCARTADIPGILCTQFKPFARSVICGD